MRNGCGGESGCLDIVLSVPNGFSLPCRVALGFFDRARGLIGTRAGDRCRNALFLPRCSSVHTCGMAYPLDLAFFRADGTVVRICRAVGAWRIRRSLGAVAVAECEAPNIDEATWKGVEGGWFRVGDVVEGFPRLLEGPA